MQDHADDCQIVQTGVCTCTRGIGQPAAQITRKRLVDEYQRGVEEGYLRGFVEGEEAAWAKMIALQNRSTVGFQDPEAEPFTQPVTIVPPAPVERPIMPLTGETPTEAENRPRHHRHRAEKTYLSEYGKQTEAAISGNYTTYTRDEFDDVPEPRHTIDRNDILYLLGLAIGFLLITGSVTWFFDIPHWPIIAIGVAVAAFFIMLIKLDHDYRERGNRVRRA